MKIKTRKVLAEQEHEWTTEVVFQSGNSFFYERGNGGTRGAYQGSSGPFDGPQEITRDAALAKCSSWGVDEVDIDE